MEALRRRTTFRGLPLTAEQESEIRHYIHCRERKALPWDTAELGSMIQDMLSPPELVAEENRYVSEEVLKENAAATENEEADESKRN